MKKLLIVGAGGWGRVVRQWAIDIQKQEMRWDSIMFLDDNIAALDSWGLQHQIKGRADDHRPAEDEEFACGIGDPESKLKVCLRLQQKGAAFINIIHPKALMTEHCRYGTGITLSPFSALVVNTLVGDFVTVNSFSIVGHDAIVERGCTLSAHCDIMANVHLEEGVFLGSGARILPNLRIGRGAKVGAGSVVIRNVAAGATVFGNPAKLIS